MSDITNNENDLIVKDYLEFIKNNNSWDGGYVEVKQDFNYDSISREFSQNAFGLFLRNVLAFSNTPRQRSAYMIYGITYDQENNKFNLTGTKYFPSPSKLFDLIKANTNLPPKCISINDHFIYDNKLFPYIAIEIVEDGPFNVTKNNLKTKLISDNQIYIRDIGKSVIAEDFQIKLMKEFWEGWIVDELYFPNTNTIIKLLQAKFDNIKLIENKGNYVRMIYESEITLTEFNTVSKVLNLIHAYPTLNFLRGDCSTSMLNDQSFANSHLRLIVGTNFHTDLEYYSGKNNFQCVKIQKLFFVNDSYANYCKAFINVFRKDIDESEIGKIIDLNYKIDGKSFKSIIEFLYSKLKNGFDDMIFVKGDLGTGKSITAKYLTYLICEQYLKHPTSSIRAVYINLNNYNVKANVNEILYPIFENLPSLSNIDKLKIIDDINKDCIYQIIDSVDEMNYQFGEKGFDQVKKFLVSFVNSISSIFFLRSTYFRSNKQMIDYLGNLKYKAQSSLNERSNISIVELCPYDNKQLERIFYSRITELDSAEQLFRNILSSNLSSLLSDPLLFYYLILFIKSESDDFRDFLSINFDHSRLRIIDFIISKILEREFNKRKRQYIISVDFMVAFEKFINMSAYKVLVLENKRKFSLTDWDEFILKSLGNNISSFMAEQSELAAAFRTMAWIKRNDENNTFEFRHETLNYLCAAKHLNYSLNQSIPESELFINELFQNQKVYDELIYFASQIYTKDNFINFISFLATTSNEKIIKLIRSIIQSNHRDREFYSFSDIQKNQNSGNITLLISLIKVINLFPDVFEALFPFIINGLTTHRKIHVLIPLLYLFNLKIGPRNSIEKQVFRILDELRIISVNWFTSGYKFHIKDQITYIKEDHENLFDKQIGKVFNIRIQDIYSYESYKNVFYLNESFVKDNIDLLKYFRGSQDFYKTALPRSGIF